jgi:hypothetical protein
MFSILGFGPLEILLILIMLVLAIASWPLRARFGKKLPWLFKTDEQQRAVIDRSLWEIIGNGIIAGFIIVGASAMLDQWHTHPADYPPPDYILLFCGVTVAATFGQLMAGYLTRLFVAGQTKAER